MKSFFKHSFCLTVVVGLVACSGSKPYQALNDFSYLETAGLREWKHLPDQKTPISSTYTIPDGNYSGALGKEVNILPPVQLLELIPAGRYKSSPYQAIFMLPSTFDIVKMNEIMRLLVQKEAIPLQQASEDGIETNWVKLDDEKEGIQARYRLTPLNEDGSRGIQVTLIEAQRNGSIFKPSDAESERFNVLMANNVLLEFDNYLREKASLQAQEQVADISIDLGTDRNGNSVIIARSTYDQFWDKLPSIFGAIGFTVEDRNRSQGTVELDYSEPDEKLWQQLNVEPVIFENSKYQLQLGDLGNRTSINVLDNAGKPLDEESLLALADALAASLKNANQL